MPVRDAHESAVAEPDYRRLLESVNAIVWRADPRTFQTTYASRVAVTLLGYPLEMWTEVPNFWIEHVHPDDRARVMEISSTAVGEGRAHDFEYRMIAADGRVLWLRNIVNVVCADGVPVELVGVSTNVTKRKEAEFEAAQLRQELGRVTRAAALGELSSYLAHELNQPLGAILSNAEAALVLLRGHPVPVPRLVDVVSDIHRDAERGGEVIHSLRRLLGDRVTERQLVHVEDVVDGVMNTLRAFLVSKRIALRVDVPPGMPPIEADAIQLQQVLFNMVMNAVEALRDCEPDQGVIQVSADSVGPIVELAVSDNGIGIRPEMMPRLFDPFVTTKSGGMGMGLAMCRRIVEAHAGHISVESNAHGGATFRVRLPVAEPRTGAVA